MSRASEKAHETLEFGVFPFLTKVSLQSFVVNVQHVKRLDAHSQEVEMADGTVVHIARRMLREIARCMD